MLRGITLGLERRYGRGYSRFARSVTLRLTSACNLACKMCRLAGSRSPDDRQELGFATIAGIVDDVARFRPYFVLTGGEPLLYADLCKVTRHIRAKRCVSFLITNGTMLGERAGELVLAPPDMLVVSIDGPAPVHDELRGRPGAFALACEGIRRVAEAGKRAGTTRPLIVVNCAITEFNYETIEELFAIARGMEADILSFQYQWFHTAEMVSRFNGLPANPFAMHWDPQCEPRPVVVEPDVIARVIQNLGRRIREERKIIVSVHPNLDERQAVGWFRRPFRTIRSRAATCAWTDVHVTPDGTIQPCLGIDCGRLAEGSLSGAWNDRAYRTYRKLLSSQRVFPICIRCCSYYPRKLA